MNTNTKILDKVVNYVSITESEGNGALGVSFEGDCYAPSKKSYKCSDFRNYGPVLPSNEQDRHLIGVNV
jgi:hypothetical protein